jgi:hypothetical protein
MGTFRVDSASPGGRRLGLGLELGWPSGATATVMLRPAHGLRVGVGAFTGLSYAEPALALRAEWLWHPFRASRSSAFDLHTHVGAGLGVVVLPLPDQRTSLPVAAWYRGPTQMWNAVRVPLGIDLALHDAPVDITLDVVPLVLVFPGAGLGLDVALGTRLWF